MVQSYSKNFSPSIYFSITPPLDTSIVLIDFFNVVTLLPLLFSIKGLLLTVLEFSSCFSLDILVLEFSVYCIWELSLATIVRGLFVLFDSYLEKVACFDACIS